MKIVGRQIGFLVLATLNLILYDKCISVLEGKAMRVTSIYTNNNQQNYPICDERHEN